MAVYRSFLFPGALVGDESLVLDGRESHHLVRVLRAQVGESIEVLDGAGLRYSGSIRVADAKAVEIVIDGMETAVRRGPRVRLVQAVSKGKAMDLILRMATEIGASEIQPVFADQGEVQIKGERLTSKVEKWRLTMIESCKQCGLPFLPKLHDPLTLGAWVAQRVSAEETLGLLASLEAGSRPLAEALKGCRTCTEWIEVAIGPEGDFSKREYTLLNASGFKPVRLGANVLRAETATAYMLSVIDQLMSGRNQEL